MEREGAVVYVIVGLLAFVAGLVVQGLWGAKVEEDAQHEAAVYFAGVESRLRQDIADVHTRLDDVVHGLLHGAQAAAGDVAKGVEQAAADVKSI